jgi:hypothetical protein
LRSAPFFFVQIYFNLALFICTLRSIFCFFSLILVALYALRPAPNFYEIHPGLNVIKYIKPSAEPKMAILTTSEVFGLNFIL